MNLDVKSPISNLQWLWLLSAFCFQLSTFRLSAQPTPVAPATQTEVNAGTVTKKFVSPATLSGWTGGGGITAATATNIANGAANTASNSLVAQISAAQVWTNDNGFIGPAFTPYHSSAEPAGTPAVAWRVFQTNDSDATLGMAVGIQSDGSVSNQNSYSIVGQNSSGRSGSSNSLYNVNGAVGVVGETLGGSVDGTGQGTGVLGYGLFGGNINYGVVGIAEADGGSPTNVGVAAAITQFGQNNKQVALYAEVSSDGLIDPIFTSAIILADSRESGFPLLVCRTNNGTFKAFEVDGTKTTNATPFDAGGRITAYGGLYAPTNYAPFTVFTNAFVLGTRYTNTVAGGFSGGRATIQASFTLNGAAAGTAKVSVYAEQGSLTNRLSISAGPLASLTIIDVLMMKVNPGGIFYFTDETSGAGASVAIVAATSSYFGE